MARKTRKARRKTRKHGPLFKADKKIAEVLFGHSPGRPTISRRAGRHVAAAIGVSEDAGTDLFHGALIAGAVALIVKK
jgi:hypothetical protein